MLANASRSLTWILAAALAATACSRGGTDDDTDAPAGGDIDGGVIDDTDAPPVEPGIDAAPEIDGTPPVNATPPQSGTIDDVRATLDGPTNLLVEGVYVTYVRAVGYTIQADPTGPAIFVFTDGAPDVTVGNRISLRVTSVATFMGGREVDGSEIVANDGGAYDVVGNLAQTISTGTGIELGEDFEAELLRVEGATVTGGGGRDFTIEFGTAPIQASLYAYEASTLGLCTGATFDVVGYDGSSDAGHRLFAYYAADFSNVNVSGCAVADDSNWDLEDWTQSNPPEDFVNASAGFTSTLETTLHHGGSASANLTWTSTANQDFVTAWKHPVTPATSYTCHFWFYDDDDAGNGRVFLTWYDAAGAALPSTYGDYTTEGTAWRELTLQEAAPASAASMTCGVRMYDVGADWDGNATVYVDDFSITSP